MTARRALCFAVLLSLLLIAIAVLLIVAPTDRCRNVKEVVQGEPPLSPERSQQAQRVTDTPRIVPTPFAGIVLKGKVVDPAGIALPQASVSAYSDEDPNQGEQSAFTPVDRDGGFELALEGIAPINGIRARAQGYQTGETRIVLGELAPPYRLQNIILRPKPTIVGMVVDVDGRGLPDLTMEVFVSPVDKEVDSLSIALSRNKPPHPVVSVTSKPDGSFIVVLESPGSYDVAVNTPGYAWALEPNVVVREDEPSRVKIVTSVAADLVCTVVDDGDRTVAGATVAMARLTRSVSEREAMREATKAVRATDALGRAFFPRAFPAVDVRTALVASKDGAGHGRSVIEAGVDSCRIKLGRGRALEIQFDNKGESKPPPPRGIRVYVTRDDVPDAFMWAGETDEHGRVAIVTAPETERFRLRMDDDQWSLAPDHTDPGAATAGTLIVVPRTGPASVRVPLVPCGRLRGVVIEELTGRRIEDVKVEAFARLLVRLTQSDVREARTRADGSFEIGGLQRAQYRLRVVSDTWQLSKDLKPIEPRDKRSYPMADLKQKDSLEGLVVLVMGNASARGVALRDGQPLADAFVRADWTGKGPSDPAVRALAERATDGVRTDAAGTFQVGGLPSGIPVRLWVSHPDHPPAFADPIILSPREMRDGIVINVGSGPSVVVTLVGPDNRPVAGVQVALQAGVKETYVAQDAFRATDTSGTVTFTNVGEGAALVRIATATLPEGLKVSNTFDAALSIRKGEQTAVVVPLIKL
jgi:hypothetical protein